MFYKIFKKSQKWAVSRLLLLVLEIKKCHIFITITGESEQQIHDVLINITSLSHPMVQVELQRWKVFGRLLDCRFINTLSPRRACLPRQCSVFFFFLHILPSFFEPILIKTGGQTLPHVAEDLLVPVLAELV